MGHFDRRSATVDEPAERRPPGSRFGDLGDRLARTFSRLDRIEPDRGAGGEDDYRLAGERRFPWDDAVQRFPITRQGYDCGAVDEHVAELEQEIMQLDQELAELRRRAPSKGEVAAEIERIGEQTSAILIAAHDQARETTRLAQTQAEQCMAEATSNAIAVTAEANLQLRELVSEKASVSSEGARLLEDIRAVAAALSSLADGAAGRFSPEPGRGAPLPVAAWNPAEPASSPEGALPDAPPGPGPA